MHWQAQNRRRVLLTAPPRCETTSSPRNARKAIKLGRFQVDRWFDGRRTILRLNPRRVGTVPPPRRSLVKPNSVLKGTASTSAQNHRRSSSTVFACSQSAFAASQDEKTTKLEDPWFDRPFEWSKIESYADSGSVYGSVASSADLRQGEFTRKKSWR